MRGGAGNDIYYVNSAADKVAENANEGQYDKVITTLASYVLGANVERVTFKPARPAPWDTATHSTTPSKAPKVTTSSTARRHDSCAATAATIR